MLKVTHVHLIHPGSKRLLLESEMTLVSSFLRCRWQVISPVTREVQQSEVIHFAGVGALGVGQVCHRGGLRGIQVHPQPLSSKM